MVTSNTNIGFSDYEELIEMIADDYLYTRKEWVPDPGTILNHFIP